MEATTDIAKRAQAALDRGDTFAAYDIAARDDGTGGAELAYLRVLTLARLGDWRNALTQYEVEGLGQYGDVDSLALKARLLKDKAFNDGGEARGEILREARDAYLAAYHETGDDFAAINAASLSSMMGDGVAAGELSRALLRRTGGSQNLSGYWQAANRAEALTILGRFDEARAVLEIAAGLPDASVAARSSTFRQLERLLEHAAIGGKAAEALLDPIRPRRVAHFCGSMLAAGDYGETRLAEEIAQALRDENVGIAFGALACGADIVIAEQALALGIELHVVFPFDRNDFVQASVITGGEQWLPRFKHCLAAATGVYAASAMRFVDDDEQFAFGSRTAMGMARLRARRIHADTVQIAVTDDPATRGSAGTAADIAVWRAAGGRTCLLPAMGIARPARSKVPAAGRDRNRRALRVLVFADFQGFSRLPEPAIPRFWQGVMASCADVLVQHTGSILATNTWGDGLHLVFDRVEAAAAALLDLRDRLSTLDPGDFGAAEVTGMRIAAHFGSVYEMIDPVTGRPNFYGSEVSRAARLEAVTPPGQVYVTEPMAAAIEMACAESFASRYVGRLSLPKNFGIEPIYALERS